jgi:hypothetical protein
MKRTLIRMTSLFALASATLGFYHAQKSGPITFSDVTVEVGLNELLKGMHGHSVAWGDINNDNYPDLFVGTFATHADEKYAHRGHGAYPEPDKLFINHGGTSFSEVTPSPTEVKGMSSGAAFADFDNDGYLDLVTSHIANTSEDTNFGRSNGLYRNDGRGGMIDLSAQSNLIFNIDTVVVSARNTFVLDYDGDGRLDLLMQDDDCWRWSIGKSHLMRNMGNMVFEDVTLEAGLPEDMNGLGGFVGDINNDTWPDIFFAHTNVMYINSRDGTFRKLDYEFFDPQYSANARDGNLVWTCGAEIGDLNGDGLLDMVMGDHFGNTLDHRARVYINKGIDKNGDPRFEEVGEEIGIDTVSQKEPYVAIEDLDNDGDMDIIVSTRESFVYTNTGNAPNGLPQFSGPTGSNGPSGGLDYWPSGGMVDYDRDGRLDYLGPQWYATVTSPLLRNVTEEAEDYIAIRMDIPGEKNRNGIGATVRIYEAGKAGKAGKASALLGIKSISVSNGYSGGCPAEAHFGTPGHKKVDITITMPCDGNVYSVSKISTKQLFTFTNQSP